MDRAANQHRSLKTLDHPTGFAEAKPNPESSSDVQNQIQRPAQSAVQNVGEEEGWSQYLKNNHSFDRRRHPDSSQQTSWMDEALFDVRCTRQSL